MKKYKIVSTTSLLPLLVTLKDEDDNIYKVNVKIDWPNDKVYFDNPEEYKDLDLKSLEDVILKRYQLPEVDIPDDVYEYFDKAKQVRSGDYATSFMNEAGVNNVFNQDQEGEEDDSRES